MIQWVLWFIGTIIGFIVAFYALKMRRWNPRYVIRIGEELKFDRKTSDAALLGFVSTGTFGLMVFFGMLLKVKTLFTEWMNPSTIAPFYICWMIFLIIALFRVLSAKKHLQRRIGMMA